MRSNLLQRVVDIVQLSEMLYYALPERSMNGLLTYLQRVVDRSGKWQGVVIGQCLQRVLRRNYNAL